MLSIIKEAFRVIDSKNVSTPHFLAKEIGISAGTSLVTWCYPNSQQDLDTMRIIRRELINLRELGQDFLPGDLERFIGHITLAYIVQPIEEADYTLFKDVIHECEFMQLGSFYMDLPELRKFESMEKWESSLTSIKL